MLYIYYDLRVIVKPVKFGKANKNLHFYDKSLALINLGALWRAWHIDIEKPMTGTFILVCHNAVLYNNAF